MKRKSLIIYLKIQMILKTKQKLKKILQDKEIKKMILPIKKA